MPDSTLLSKLTVRNFKSITSASIEFSGMTFMVGRNGSGKSNVSDALSFVAEAMDWPLQTVFNRRGGPLSVARKLPISSSSRTVNAFPIKMGIAVEFHNLENPHWRAADASRGRYAFQLSVERRGFSVDREQCSVYEKRGTRTWFDRDRSTVRSNIDFLKSGAMQPWAHDSLMIPLIGGFLELRVIVEAMRSMAVYSIDPSKLREFQDPDPGKRLLPDGSNAASVLAGLESNSTNMRRLFEILSSIVPDLERVRAQTTGRKQLLKFVQRWSGQDRVTFDAFNMSDGTLRAFGILLALFQHSPPNLVVIEEPESSLHPAAAAAVIETLRQASARTQIIVTTHSPEILDYVRPEHDSLKVISWRNGQSTIGDVAGAATIALQQHLSSAGELFRMRILDAEPLFETQQDDQQNLFEDLSDHSTDS